jgi:hypothetical protein
MSIDPHTDDFEYTEEDSAAFRRKLLARRQAQVSAKTKAKTRTQASGSGGSKSKVIDAHSSGR